MDLSHYISLFDVAKRLEKSRPVIHKLCKRGEFPSAIRVGRYYFVDPVDVEAYQSRQATIRQTLGRKPV